MTASNVSESKTGNHLATETAGQLEAEVESEIQRIVPEAFSVCSPETAAWVVRQIINARTYSQKVQAWAAMEQRRAVAEEEHLLFRFGHQLRGWAEVEIRKLRGRKSINLPSGTVGFRSVPARVVFDDEDAVLAWAKVVCPAAVVTNERLLKKPVVEHITATGEVPERGLHAEPSSETFYIK